MANYIDGLQLVSKATGTSMEKKYYNDLQDIKDMFAKFKKGNAPAQLIFKREWSKRWNNLGTTYKPISPIWVPLRASYYDAEGAGAIDIRYSTSPPEKINGRLRWNKAMERIDDIYVVNENQLDLAWFFLKASSFFNKGVLKLVDEGVEIETKWETMALQADVSIALKNITEEELAQVYAYFLNGVMTYIENDSVKANAMRIWDKAIIDSKNGKSETMTALKNALDKVIKPEKEELGSVIVDEVEYPVQEMPEGWTKATILKEFENYKIEPPKKMVKNAVLYTILKAKIANLK